MRKLAGVLAVGVVLAVAGLAMAGSTGSQSITFTTSGFEVTGIGLEDGYPSTFDWLVGTGTAGKFSIPLNGSPVIATINDSVTFTVGYNRWSNAEGAGVVTQTMAINDGEGQIITQNFKYRIADRDSVFMLEGQPAYFSLGKYGLLQVTPQPLSFELVSVGQPLTQPLTAEFRVVGVGRSSAPVPEPITMIGAFMGISGLGMYVRKRTKVTA